MSDKTTILTATKPDGSTVFAGINPGVRYVTGAVADNRLGAHLTPFLTEEEALAALDVVGAKVGGAAK